MRRIKSRQLPKRYRPGFLENLDARSAFALRLRELHSEIIEDLGGEIEVSAAKRVLIERFVFLVAQVQEWEVEMFRNENKDGATIDKWVYAINALQGLASKIGLGKDHKTIDLKDYLATKGK